MDHSKLFILDTNILLYNADSIFKFQDNEIVIPLAVIEQIDNNKKGFTEAARNARKISRILSTYMNGGNLLDGVQLNNGGKLRIEINHSDASTLPFNISFSDPYDARILAVAYNTQKQFPNRKVVLVSKDIDIRILANVLQIENEDFKNDKIDYDSFYTGVTTLNNIQSDIIDRLYSSKNNMIHISELLDIDEMIYENQFVIFKSHTESQSAITRYKSGYFNLLKPLNKDIWGIKPLNLEQKFAFDLLLDDSVKCVTLSGKSGSGKTLLALAAALYKVVDESKYKRLLVARPTVENGPTLGLLPGNKREKLDEYMAPIYDNFDFLFDSTEDSKESFKYFEDSNVIIVEALQYMRGRTLPNQWFICDETQNISPKEMKTLVTRMGKHSKLILTGDPDQIDHAYLDSSSNGLSYLVEKFKNQKIYGHVTLNRCERGELADLGASLL